VLAYVAEPQAPGGYQRREVPEPEPLDHQAVVEVEAFSLNRGEIGHIALLPPGTVLGWDLAGTVVRAAADGTGPAVGAAVYGCSFTRGAWAERVAVAADSLALRPEGAAVTDVATLGIAGLTALYALRHGGPLLGRTVLVTGAAGGVGRLAVQLAHRAGASVLAVVGQGPGRDLAVTGLGLERVTLERGLEARGTRAHLVLESVGGASMTAAFTRVAEGGTIVSYGRSAGEPATLPADWFFTNATLHGLSVAYEHALDRTAPSALQILGDLVGARRLDAGVSLQADWAELPGAIEALMERRVAGKAVLTLR